MLLWRLLAIGLAMLLSLALAQIAQASQVEVQLEDVLQNILPDSLVAHMPLKYNNVTVGTESSRIVQSGEILQKIELGLPVEYNKITVIGDLNVSGLELQRVGIERTRYERKYLRLPEDAKLVVTPIEITNSLILGSVNLNGTILQGKMNFANTKFERPVYFKKTRFNQLAEFQRARFNQYAGFTLAQFNQTADFFSSQFNQSAEFSRAKFNKTADFSSAQFNRSAEFSEAMFGHANFLAAQFNQSAHFSEAQFSESADFHSTLFNQSAYFSKTRFNRSADFMSARFNQYAYFSNPPFSEYGAHFGQSADFRGARFNQYAAFWGVQFNQSAKFSMSQFNQSAEFSDSQFDQYADFGWSRFNKEAIFNGALFTDTLSLESTKYDKLNIRWSSIHDLAYDDTVYYLLIENFKKQGFFDDANECYYSYRCKHGWELLRQGKIFNWFFDSLAWGTYGYGLQPWQPLGWSICFILLGGIFFWHSKGIMRKESESKDVSIWEAFLLSATYYTSGASAIISSTPMEFTPQGKARYVVVLLRLSGWIFFVLFLSSLTRIV